MNCVSFQLSPLTKVIFYSFSFVPKEENQCFFLFLLYFAVNREKIVIIGSLWCTDADVCLSMLKLLVVGLQHEHEVERPGGNTIKNLFSTQY